MRAAVVIEKPSDYQVVSLSDRGKEEKLLVIDRKTETGELFRVVAGYYLGEKEKYDDDSTLVEVEIVPMGDYSRVKTLLRARSEQEKRKAPITFW